MAYQFPEDIEKKFQWLITRYPKKDAILLPLLHLVQKDVGYLSSEAIVEVARKMELTPARIREVASFYTMFRLNKKGQYVLGVCQTLSCYLNGSEELITKLKNILNIKEGQTSEDGLFTIERVECLASCGTAPVMQVNDWEYHENLTVEKIEKIISLLKEHKAADISYEKRLSSGGVA